MAELALWRIEAPHFVAGTVTEGRLVVTVAPILHYMEDWSITEMDNYCKKKGWTLTCLGSVREEKQDKPQWAVDPRKGD